MYINIHLSDMITLAIIPFHSDFANLTMTASQLLCASQLLSPFLSLLKQFIYLLIIRNIIITVINDFC
jgi:hypothetical protein